MLSFLAPAPTIQDKDELDLYDNECHNAAEKASVPTPPEHLPTQPTQAMETPVQSTGAPTVPPKNTTSSGCVQLLCCVMSVFSSLD